jgi:hypothetical protein
MEDAKKRRGRSPNCPGISLTDALQRARKIYEEEHTHPTDRLVIAKDLGYAGISGASATMMGALRQYGILEDAGNGMRISPDAVTAFEAPADSPEKIEALERMAFAPALFAELRAEFPGRLPGEVNLRHLLIKKGFLPKQADDVSQAYRENFDLFGNHNTRYNGEQEQAEMQGAEVPTETRTTPATRTVMQGAMKLTVAIPSRTYAFDISIPREVKGELRIVGEFGKDDLERLRKALNGQLAMIEAALED